MKTASLTEMQVAPAHPLGALGFVRDVIALGKPRITFMVLCTTAGGYFLAPAAHPLQRFCWLMLGMSIVVAAANTLNMYLERDVDALMERTRYRPLPARRLPPQVALVLGLGAAGVAVPLLTFLVNATVGLCAAISLLLYVLAYTPMKRISTVALLVGAVPGAMPPLIGFAAANEAIDLGGLSLFWILFFWQLPHFIAISLFRKSDYDAAGLKIVPTESGLGGAKWRIVVYTVLLVVASVDVFRRGLSGPIYLGSALLLGLAFLILALAGMRAHTPRRVERWARLLFIYSLLYLPALFAALLIGRA